MSKEGRRTASIRVNLQGKATKSGADLLVAGRLRDAEHLVKGVVCHELII
jgi:hypothetical protein